jgi:hypothetical protein
MADWKDILNNDERQLSEDDLLKYLNMQSSENDKKQSIEASVAKTTPQQKAETTSKNKQ